jgi:hypothetical protein
MYEEYVISVYTQVWNMHHIHLVCIFVRRVQEWFQKK